MLLEPYLDRIKLEIKVFPMAQAGIAVYWRASLKVLREEHQLLVKQRARVLLSILVSGTLFDTHILDTWTQIASRRWRISPAKSGQTSVRKCSGLSRLREHPWVTAKSSRVFPRPFSPRSRALLQGLASALSRRPSGSLPRARRPGGSCGLSATPANTASHSSPLATQRPHLLLFKH